MGDTGANEQVVGDGDGTYVLRVAPRTTASTPSSICSRIIGVVSAFIVAFTLCSHIYILYLTRDENFKGIWLVRGNIVLLIIVYAAVVFGYIFRSDRTQLPPSCLSLKYVKFRWPVWILAFFALSSIPILFFSQRHADSNLFVIFRVQIEYALLTVLIFVAFDTLSRYLYHKQLEQAAQQRPVSPPPQLANPQYGYFSPKSKKGAPTLTSQKSPFDSGKFHYAR